MYEPTPHQVEDSEALLDYEHGYLWADAGTGKTVTVMEAFRKGPHEKLIVICPRIAVTMWKRELEYHLRDHSKVGNKQFYARAIGSGATIRSSGKSPVTGKVHGYPFLTADAVITTFDLFAKHRDMFHKFVLGQYAGKAQQNPLEGRTIWENRHKVALVLDEAHMLKSRDAKRTKALFAPGFNCTHPGGFLRNVTDVWQLTGTPVMRYHDDLWTQLVVCRREILAHYGVSQYSQWVDKFCTTTYKQYGRGQPILTVTGNKNHKLLMQLLDDCKVIRRKLADVVADLPPVTHRVIDTPYTGVRNIKTDGIDLIRELNKPDSEAATARRLLGIAKVPAVVDYAGEYGKVPLLIGYWHKDVGAALEKALCEHYNVIERVDGSTSNAKRDDIALRFNDYKVDVLIGQMQAMNTSWNLQGACSHVIIAEELPSPGMLHQFYSRVYRRGQKNHVQIDYMLSDHGLDTAMMAIRERKGADNEKVGV